MKRRIIYSLLALVLLYLAAKEAKGPLVHLYVRNYYDRETATPGTAMPDQIWLTMTANPRESQAVQWRTGANVADGWVQYHKAGQHAITEVAAASLVIEDPLLKNDPVNQRHSALMPGLDPQTSYEYRVGSKEVNSWSDWSEFETAPAGNVPFSFVYLGDPQLGFGFWARLLREARDRVPGAAFYAIAGDLVNDGDLRDEWDAFFAAGDGTLNRTPAVPALGNHDYTDEHGAKVYLDLLTLPENGPDNVPKECAYAFRYSNALFVVMDSNLDPVAQAPWLEKQLAHTEATWKFVCYHHPAYSSRTVRDNREVREVWGALFDKYHVDMALQGHDHAYLRTWPMRAGKRVGSPAEGTIYVVSVSGTKFYEQDPSDYTAIGFEHVSTYQVINIGTNPDVLTYRAYDIDGEIRDEFVIRK